MLQLATRYEGGHDRQRMWDWGTLGRMSAQRVNGRQAVGNIIYSISLGD